MIAAPDPATPVRVVLADANVLYSRILRDYLLYAAEAELISITWSRAILDEVTEHLIENLESFTSASARRLIAAMNDAFPYAEINPTSEDYERLASLPLPDEDDRHVLAAALASEATTLCTANTKDFPATTIDPLGLELLTPDELLSQLIDRHPRDMLRVHRTSVARLPGATDASTLTALRRAGAPAAASKMGNLLTTPNPHSD